MVGAFFFRAGAPFPFMVLVAPYFFLYDPEGGRRMLGSAGEGSLAFAKYGLSISLDQMTGLHVQVSNSCWPNG